MNRQRAKNVNISLRDAPKNPDTIDQELRDLTLDDLAFLGSNSGYHYKHIAGVAKSLCKTHGFCFEQQFEVVGSTEQLAKFLKEPEPPLIRKTPLFIIYCINNVHWVTFCITRYLDGVVVLYKDSQGGDMPDEIRKTLKQSFGGAIVAVHRTREQRDGNSCGPAALRNMEIIMEMLKGVQQRSVADGEKGLVALAKKGTVTDRNKGPVTSSKKGFDTDFQVGSVAGSEKGLVALAKKGTVTESKEGSVADSDSELVTDFKRKLFCSSSEIESVKKRFKDLVGKDIVATCIELANELASNTEFKQDVGKLVESCVKCVGVLHDVEEYVKHLQRETESQERSAGYQADMKDINATRHKIMEHPDVKAWAEQARKAIEDNEAKEQTGNENEQSAGVQSELERKYPELLTKFTKVFQMLGVDLRAANSVRDGGVRQVSEILEIDYEKIKEFYKTLRVEPPPPVQSQEEVVEPVGIEELARQVGGVTLKQTSEVDENVKPTKQILAELASGAVNEKEIAKLTGEGKKEFYQKVNEDNAELKRLYDEVKKHYNDWKDKGVKEIKAWALSNKGNLGPSELCKAVAIMDRANRLVTGHFLRDTQILAVLASLNGGESQGKLCQIATGEGKTVIVSLIATIKVLQGKKVDVITSNGVLAEEGVDARGNFFGVFGISVAHNNPDESYKRGPMKCYTADVVYGSMGSFQFDHLKDSFEGLGTRGRRKFEFVILDEVDSLLLDNGGHVAKLAEPFPGFDSLKYVYIKIWQELAKAEREVVRECEEKLKRKAEDLKKEMGSESTKEFQEEYVRYRSELLKNQDKTVEKIKKSDPANIDLIPVHLRQFAREMVDVWIQNAIYAKYSCRENEQYVVRTLENAKEPKIVPVDYQGTGVTLKNTMWSNGLHQFVQLKHNLHLTSETLTSSLISNIGYVKLYNNNLFGLTGTLGSTAEQELLSSVYNVKHSKVPTFKPKVFEEFAGKVVTSDQFKKSIVEEALKLTSKGRSVLIICSTINDALGLEKKIKKNTQDISLKINTYFDEASSEIVKSEIGPGEIVISTNIAGRGSDFRTSVELESNGGLHVLVCFLPVNQRVEDQAFGRTSRQGNKGTAQIVMRDSEMLGLGFEAGQRLPFSEIKGLRDQLEAERLEQIRKVELAQIDFQDRIFGLFSNLYRKAMKHEEGQPSALYLLKDLKECWAFWLHKKQKQNIAVAKVAEEFEKFKHEARHILGEEREDTFVGGSITHNPYYSIQQAEHFILNDLHDGARNSLNHAISISRKNSDLLYAAYIKMFEVELEQGDIVMSRFFTLLKSVVPIDFNPKKEGKDDYKKKARDALEKAKKALEKEIRYIETNFTGLPNNGDQANQTGNQDFVNILDNDPENVLVRHLTARLSILQSFLQHVLSLLGQLTASIGSNVDIALISRVADFWRSNNLPPSLGALRMLMGGADGDEFREFFSIGLGTMFALREFPFNPDNNPYLAALIQIGAGLAALATGAAFPPSLPVMAKIAEVFICEGIGDIIVIIITGVSKFDIKSKLISYGTQAITIGIFALLKYTKVAQKAINLCRRMITYLESSPNLRRLAEVLVPVLEKVITTLESQIRIARSATITLSGAALRIGKSAAKKVFSIGVQHTLVVKAVDLALNPWLISIKGYVSVVILLRIDQMHLTTVAREIILQRADKILEAKSSVGFIQIASSIAENVANSYGRYQSFDSHVEQCERMVIEYAVEVCDELENIVQQAAEGEVANSEEEVEGIVEELVDMIAKHVLGQIKKKTVKFAMKEINRQLKKI